MGIIKRQTIKQSIVNYLAIGVAAFSTMFIYPIDKEAYGLATFVLSAAQFLMILVLFGFNGAAIRFFSNFQEERQGQHGFLFYMFCGVLAGTAVVLLAWLLFKGQIYGVYADRPAIYSEFLPHILLLAVLMAFFQLFMGYVSNFKRIVVPALLLNLIKLSLPLLILLHIWGDIKEEGIINGILGNYAIALALLIGYLMWLGAWQWKPDFSWFTKERNKEVWTFAMYSLVGGIGGVLVFRIDSIMVSTLLDFKSNGVYMLAAFLGNVIAVPAVGMLQISAPIISESFAREDYSHISYLYKQSSVNLLIVGLYLLVCIVVSVEDLFSLMPKSEEMTLGFWVVLLIGIGKVVEMGTSVNHQIINYSKYFRFTLVATAILAVVNVAANLILIPKYGIVGAALSTMMALALFNFIKLVFIYWKFGMQPFTMKTIYVLLIAAVCFLIGHYLPLTGHAVWDILLRSSLISIVFLPSIYFFKISEDLNQMIDSLVGRIAGRQ